MSKTRLKVGLSEGAQRLKQELENSVIGQSRAIKQLVQAYERIQAGIHAPDRPLAVLMFLGPSGVGKSELARALAKALLGGKNALTRIDCAEFQKSHEVSKLIGAPPGYIGFREGDGARLAQDKLDKFQSKDKPYNVLLIDEIEKAASEFFDFWLGVFDSGKATLGNGQVTDFTKTIIIITSNLSSHETHKLIHDSGLGFRSEHRERKDLDSRIWKLTKESVRKFFRPEFVNRIDKFVSFHSLSQESLGSILDLELIEIQKRLHDAGQRITLKFTSGAKRWLLKEGTSEASGARELKRVLESQMVSPVASLLSGSDVLYAGDTVHVGVEHNKLVFYHEWSNDDRLLFQSMIQVSKLSEIGEGVPPQNPFSQFDVPPAAAEHLPHHS